MVTYVAIIKKFHTKTQSVISLLLICFSSYFFLLNLFFRSFELHTHTYARGTLTHSRHTQQHTHTRCHPVARVEARERWRGWERKRASRRTNERRSSSFYLENLIFTAIFRTSPTCFSAIPIALNSEHSLWRRWLFIYTASAACDLKTRLLLLRPFCTTFSSTLRCLCSAFFCALLLSARRFFSIFSSFLVVCSLIFFLACSLLFAHAENVNWKLETTERQLIFFFWRLFTPHLNRPHQPALRLSVANR